MGTYDVIISPKALSQLNDYVDYIHFTLANPQAAKSVWQDALDTADTLETSAGSLNFCKHPKLKQLGYHPIFFRRHDYVMLYRIDGSTAYVEAIYHMLQDYENTFAQEN